VSAGGAGLYVGLMSGTSLDGVDAALVAFDGEAERPDGARLLAFRTDAYDPELRGRLAAVVRGEAGGATLCDLGFELGHRFADAGLALLGEAGVDPSDVVAVGSHGQTIWHRPPGEDADGATLQVGEAAVVAERLGVDVIADFRVRDVAAGGHGAPLSPLFDLFVLRDPARGRAIQNLGGMGNVTGLPAEGSAARPSAFDTGPGVALLDGAVRRLTGGREAYDRDGRRGAAGRAIPEGVEAWLSDPFFLEAPPRTTGRERFGDAALEAWLERFGDAPAGDLLATLAEVTARSVAESYRFLGFAPDEILLCGGGARNPELVRRIAARLGPDRVRPLEALGWNGDAREAAAFALLARQHVLGHAVDLAWATGARGPRRLGKRVPA